jgi:SAM-dependent methyltransferase
MSQLLHGVVRATAETFDLPEPLVEISAGQEGLPNLRPLFRGKRYLGLDRRSGPGVDRTTDLDALPLADASAGTVLAMNIFAHVPHFWRGFAEVARILRPDGMVLLSCPFYSRVHRSARDYWRFTAEALDLLLEGYPSRILGWHGPHGRPLHVWAVAFGNARPAPTPAQLAYYRTLLGYYVRQPLGWWQRVRYLLGRCLCGRGPFAPYLGREQWEIECRHPQLQVSAQGLTPARSRPLTRPPLAG